MASLLVFLLLLAQGASTAVNDALWEAARNGDVAAITAALDKGANVNARARYDMTALAFAADKGHVDAVRLLLARGADPSVQDTFYRFTALSMALSNRYSAAAVLLLQAGSPGADAALQTAVAFNDAEVVKAALASPHLTRAGIEAASAAAEKQKRTAMMADLKAALDARPATPAFNVPADVLARYVGTYRDATSGVTFNVAVRGDGALTGQVVGQPAFVLTATDETRFSASVVPNFSLRFNARGNLTESITIVQGPTTINAARVPGGGAAPAGPPGATVAAPANAAAPAAATPPPAAASTPAVAASTPAAASAAVDPASTAPRNWPSFRGDNASGNGDGQRAVTEWDVASGRNIRWKTAIPGMTNSSPVVWGSRIFTVSAASKGGDATFRTGLYGDVKPVDDLSPHEWKVYCLDKNSGKILWERVVFAGAPKVKRHTKASQANSTPATDGRHVVAAFGTIGLVVVFDMDGKELWRKDVGVLDSGWFLDPSYQWGHSSSPIIYRNSVILQADRQKESYIAAWDITTGRELWRSVRTDEISTWGTPAIVRTADGRDELVTNGTKARGYDPATGALRWTLGPNSEITIATPVAGNGLVFVTGGYPPVRPIYAIRPGASGDISLPKGSASSAAIAWSNLNEGTYIPSPLVYRDLLFTLNVNGIVTAYRALTGERAFRGRVGVGGAFSASLVAADGRLYVTSEDGDIYVVAAAEGLTEVSKNAMNEVVMGTLAISDGLIVVRTLGHIYGIGAAR